jgi:hypothetical protein
MRGRGRWHIPDARQGRTGAPPRKVDAAPGALAACQAAEPRTRWPLGSRADYRATAVKHSAP